MAFNPFHSFRKHQKVVFTGLVLAAMFSFILFTGGSLAQGDPMQVIGRWFGQSRYPDQVNLFGKGFDGAQIQQIQTQRRLANYFMEAAVSRVQQNIVNKVVEEMPKLDPAAQEAVNRILQTRMLALRFGDQFLPYYRQQLTGSGFAPGLVRLLQEQADRALADKKNDQATTLLSLQQVLLQDRTKLERTAGELYFGGREGQIDDLVNFLIWRHEADRLGITFSPQDITAAVNNETLGRLTKEDETEIATGLRDMFRGAYSPELLRTAMSDEFRVRTAQAALVGVSPGTYSAVPAILTPDEAWDLFRDQRTAIKASVIEVPVDGKLAQVTGTASDAELRKLFTDFKNDEPAPYREQPGFKEPRYVKVEWVAAQADLPFYKKAAANLDPLLQALAQVGVAAAAADCSLGTAAAVAVPVVLDAPLVNEYGRYQSRELPWTDNLTPQWHDTSVLRPENFAILVGAAGGAIGTDATLFSAPLAFQSRIMVRDIRDRARVGTSYIMSGALEPAALAAFALPGEVIPKEPTVDHLREQLQVQTREELARQLVQADLKAFDAEVTKLGQDRDKKSVGEYIARFVKERGLKHAEMAEARDQYSIFEDPALLPLREAYLRGQSQSDKKGLGFFQAFFGEPNSEMYKPAIYPAAFGEKDVYRFWRTEDREPRVVSFDRAKAKVEAAWKVLKARELAQKEADRLSVDAGKLQGDPQKLRDLAAGAKLEFFDLGPQAMRNPKPAVFPGQPREYEPFRVPEDRVTYPGDMATQVIAMRGKPKGATIVVSDMPKSHYFVVTLLEKSEPSQEEFRRAYIESTPRATGFDPLIGQLAFEKQLQYRRDVLQQLRSDAKVVVNTDRKGGGTPADDGE